MCPLKKKRGRLIILILIFFEWRDRVDKVLSKLNEIIQNNDDGVVECNRTGGVLFIKMLPNSRVIIYGLNWDENAKYSRKL